MTFQIIAGDNACLQDALEHLRGADGKWENFQGFSALMETHFRDNREIYRAFQQRNYIKLEHLLEKLAMEKDNGLKPMILLPQTTLASLRNEVYTIEVLGYLVQACRAFQRKEPVFDN